MPGFTFDSTFPDGSPRRFAGTWRPPRMDAEKFYEALPFDQRINTMQSGEAADFVLLNWQKGALDQPLYHIEEWEQ